jgi:four helix bundle protein
MEGASGFPVDKTGRTATWIRRWTMGITRFDQLDVWRTAHRAALAVYELTARFPRHELFGLTSQLRRAAVSVPTNIVEGFNRLSPREKVRFYNISQSSAEEVKYELMLARDLRYCPEPLQLRKDLDDVCRGLCRLIQRIASSPSRSPLGG